jgi:hypothetical protein
MDKDSFPDIFAMFKESVDREFSGQDPSDLPPIPEITIDQEPPEGDLAFVKKFKESVDANFSESKDSSGNKHTLPSLLKKKERKEKQ